MKSEGSGSGLELCGHSKGFGLLHVDHVWYICVNYDHIFPPSSLCVPTIPFSQGPRERDIQSPISRQSNGSTPTPDGYAGLWSLPGFLPPDHIVLTQLGPLPRLPSSGWSGSNSSEPSASGSRGYPGAAARGRVFQDIQTTYQMEPGSEGGIKEAAGVTKSTLPAPKVCGLAGTSHTEWPTSPGPFPLLSNKGSYGKAVSPCHLDE